MAVLKIIGYHLLWLVYYGIVFSIMVFTYSSPGGSTHYNPIGVILSISAFISPFFISSRLINRFYYGKRKAIHAKVWAIVYMICTFFYMYGAYDRHLSIYDYSLIFLNSFIAISLFWYREPEPEPDSMEWLSVYNDKINAN